MDYASFEQKLTALAIPTSGDNKVLGLRDVLHLASAGVGARVGGPLPMANGGGYSPPSDPAPFAPVKAVAKSAADLKPAEGQSPRFRLGSTSVKNLRGVHPRLVSVVELAIGLTTQDFTVYEGLRTAERQKKLVEQGFSRTRNSKHLIQSDGLGHAVDLVPWINGIPKWDWEGCYKIAFAVDQAATQLGCAQHIRWGGAWDRTLADFGSVLADYRKEVEAYASRHPGKDFLDGPHFEWRS